MKSRGTTNGPPARPTRGSEAAAIPDVQASRDSRRVAIDKVGVKDVTYPMRLRTRDGGEQSTVATINMYVSLPHYQKGTHMSRFLEVLNEHVGSGAGGAGGSGDSVEPSVEPITPDRIPQIAAAICKRLSAETAHFEAVFTYFINKQAPVTKSPGLMDYKVRFVAEANGTDDFVMTVAAPATSLCPCSKEISAYGAHNQRCTIEASVRFRGMVWIEDLVDHLESAASVPVFAVLKRPDEKHVTEAAYDNPKFVEDIVRDLAIRLEGDDRITWFSINSENFESIHNHNAYAQLTRDKR